MLQILVNASICNQQDGTPAHFIRGVREFISIAFLNCLMERKDIKRTTKYLDLTLTHRF